MAKTKARMRLVGEDGNAFAIMGRACQAMSRAGVPKAERDEYVKEATAGDYDNLLRVTMEWVACDEEGGFVPVEDDDDEEE